MSRHTEGPWFRTHKNTWYVWFHGRQMSLGVHGRQNKKHAWAAWRALMADGSTRETPKAKAVTVGEIITGFLADVEGRAKEKTVEVYNYFLLPFAQAHGRLLAGALTPALVEKYSKKATWGGSTRYGFIGAVVASLRWAVRSGLIPSNPISGIRKPPKASRGSRVVLTEDEFSRLCDASSPAFRVFLRGLWATGCRPGELAQVKAADVDLTAGVVILNQHKTAETTGRPRFVYLSPGAMELFKTQVQAHPTGPLFRNNLGGVWNEDSVVGAMKKARQKAKLPNAIAYGMRHSFATAALVAGVPDAQVAALLGHVGTGMLFKHYSHLTAQAQALRAAASRVRG